MQKGRRNETRVSIGNCQWWGDGEVKEQPPAVGKMEVLKSWYELTMLFLLQAVPEVVSTTTSTQGAGIVSTLEQQSAQ